MHRVIKNWDFHTESIHSFFVNESFTKILSGGANGDLFLTDIVKNFYCPIDNIKDEHILSIAMTEKNQIFVSTDKNKLLEYVRKK